MKNISNNFVKQMGEIENQKILFNLTPSALELLSNYKEKLMSMMDSILNDFYRAIINNHDLKSIIGDTDLAVIKIKQKDHWEKVFNCRFDQDYFASCLRIGTIHYKIGLNQVTFISSYNFIIQRTRKSILAMDEGEENKLLLSNVVQSAFLLDMGLILSDYATSRRAAGEAEASEHFANDMIDSTINISMALNETAISSAEMVQSIRHVDENAQGIAAAIEETVASMNSINQSTQDAARIANETKNMAEHGEQIVDNAYKQTEQISTSVLSSVTQVEKLTEASQKIGDIVAQIEGIAGQTNLLALNATIEAARAGEAGRGFAVVASEVKNLSTQTAQATIDIKTRIQSLLEEMNSIVQSMQTAKEDVEKGQEVMGEVKEQMSDMGQNIDQMNQSMVEISGILSEQAEATTEVSRGAINIANDSEKNSVQIMGVVKAMQTVVSLVGNQINSLSNYEIPNKIVRIAKSDHIIWKKRLVDMMVGFESLQANELADHHSCRLGKWYYSEDSLLYREHPSFKALENCHREVHENGIRAAQLHNDGDTEAALQQIPKVEAASKEVIHHLDKILEDF
jgi:methyl-accepting chemotaxis protein